MNDLEQLAIVLNNASEHEGENRLNLKDIEMMARLYLDVRPVVVVDIGTYRGKSAKVWRYLGAERVYTIDVDGADIPGVKCIRGKSSEVDIGEDADLVWIDGDHSYSGVMADLRRWMPLAKKMICGHDYTDSEPELMKAVHQFFGGFLKHQDVIWWVDKR